MRHPAILVALLVVSIPPTWALTAEQEAKLLASDGGPHDYFGVSVALDGDTALVGARGDDDHGDDSGSAYVFVRTGDGWTEQAKLLPADPLAGVEFGISAALDGDTAIVGAQSQYGNLALPGAAYVFTRSGGIWTEQAKLLADDGTTGKEFGARVALDGDTALVSAHRDDDNGSSSGSVYVFTRTGINWRQQAKLLASDGVESDHFGESVAIEGHTALVGAPHVDDHGNWSGAAYVFVRTGTVWEEQEKLWPHDAAAYQVFGESVAIEGDIAVVGATGVQDQGYGTGAAYVFNRTGGAWSQEARLTSSAPEAYQQFGASTAISQGLVLIGAPYLDQGEIHWPPGSGYLFARIDGQWRQEAKLQPSNGFDWDNAGLDLDLDGNAALLGSMWGDPHPWGSGSAYVFRISDDEVPAVGGPGIAILLATVLGVGLYLARGPSS